MISISIAFQTLSNFFFFLKPTGSKQPIFILQLPSYLLFVLCQGHAGENLPLLSGIVVFVHDKSINKINMVLRRLLAGLGLKEISWLWTDTSLKRTKRQDPEPRNVIRSPCNSAWQWAQWASHSMLHCWEWIIQLWWHTALPSSTCHQDSGQIKGCVLTFAFSHTQNTHSVI